MRTIYKYRIDGLINNLALPEGTKVLSVGLDPVGAACIWAEVDTEAPESCAVVHVVGTGHELPDDPGEYIGTFSKDYFMWHAYCRFV